MHLLFVYGTLMRGQPSDGYLAGKRWFPATVHGHLYRVPAGYPALVLDPEGPQISGELYTGVDDALLRLLDVFEGVPQELYVRQKVDVTIRNRTGQAWAYVISAPEARMRGYIPLKTTDWRHLAPPYPQR